MSNDETTRSISIHYDEASGKRVVPVAGAYGGPNHDGAYVVAHVYSEWNMVPSIQQVPVSQEGVADSRKASSIRRGELHREIQATLMLTPEVAISVGEWLVTRGRQAKELRGRTPRPPEGDPRPDSDVSSR